MRGDWSLMENIKNSSKLFLCCLKLSRPELKNVGNLDSDEHPRFCVSSFVVV
jgi:hypothetical protein